MNDKVLKMKDYDSHPDLEFKSRGLAIGELIKTHQKEYDSLFSKNKKKLIDKAGHPETTVYWWDARRATKVHRAEYIHIFCEESGIATRGIWMVSIFKNGTGDLLFVGDSALFERDKPILYKKIIGLNSIDNVAILLGCDLSVHEFKGYY